MHDVKKPATGRSSGRPLFVSLAARLIHQASSILRKERPRFREANEPTRIGHTASGRCSVHYETSSLERLIRILLRGPLASGPGPPRPAPHFRRASTAVYMKSPDLVKERVRPGEGEQDRLTVPALNLLMFAQLLLAGLNVGRLPGPVPQAAADQLALGGGSTSPFSSSSFVSILFVLLFRFLFDRLKRDTLNRFHSVSHGVERPLNLRLSLL